MSACKFLNFARFFLVSVTHWWGRGDGDSRSHLPANPAVTDFTLDEITLWFTTNVILLPSEY